MLKESASPSASLWKPEEWLSNINTHRIYFDDCPAHLVDRPANLIDGGPAFHWEGRVRKKNGEQITMDIWTVARRRDDNSQEFITVCHDITQRRRYEEELRQAQSRLQTIIDSVPGLVSYMDAAERYAFVNKRYEEWFGENPASILGRHLLILEWSPNNKTVAV